MFLSFYTFIVILIVFDNVDVTECHQDRSTLKSLRDNTFLPKHRKIVKREAINKRFPITANNVKLFNHIHENSEESENTLNKYQSPSLEELKTILQRLLNKLNALDARHNQFRLPSTNVVYPRFEESTKPNVLLGYKKRTNEGDSINTQSRWGEWTNWSSCSVSCGKGRKIRWRHCLNDCDLAETEMEEKTCQLPACSPGNLFGLKL